MKNWPVRYLGARLKGHGACILTYHVDDSGFRFCGAPDDPGSVVPYRCYDSIYCSGEGTTTKGTFENDECDRS